MAIVTKVKIDGTNLEKPSEYFKPVAHTNSKIPAITNTIHAVEFVIARPSHNFSVDESLKNLAQVL